MSNAPRLQVSVTGTPQEDQILTASSNANHVQFQWQHSADNGTTWSDISGANATTYTVTEADENDLLRVSASIHHHHITATSSATTPVVDVPPAITVTVSGDPQQGQTLTANPTIRTDDDNSINDVTYQWQRSADNGATWTTILGATAKNYTLNSTDAMVRAITSFTDDTGQTVVAGSNGVSTNHFHVMDTTTGDTFDTPGTAFSGPVSGINWQFIVPQDIITHNLNITSLAPNVFIQSGSGNNALDMNGFGGLNILDGSTGSNFLTGGPGVDQFFVDDRNPSSDIWTTIANLQTGDSAVIWGLTPDSPITTANDVLPSAPGLDFAIPGSQNVNLTIEGYSTDDLSNGRLSVSFGHTSDTANLPGSDFMQIHANS